MKVIEEFEIKYLEPENDKESLDIQEIIDDFENNKNRNIDYNQLKKIDNRNRLKNGFWRKL